MVPPAPLPDVIQGHKGLAVFIKYAIEKGAYDQMVASNDIDFMLKKQKKSSVNNLFYQIKLNYFSKMSEIQDMKELVKLLI